MSAPLAITVYSDVICPWCYVGKRRLEAALADLGMLAEVGLAWRPFELNPDMPAEGMDRRAYRERKFGVAKGDELDGRMAETGRELGIAFAFDRMRRTPNTRLAHRLIWEAGRQGLQDALVNRLFQAYFEEGLDVGAANVLTGLAADAGLDMGGVQRALSYPESLEAVIDLEEQGYHLGIQGVPFFILLGKYGVSGAQPPDYWRDTLSKIATEAGSALAGA